MDCNEILFSIVIPVYNIEEYIEECINSVINQNFGSMEIILIDDGSKDRSGELCDKSAFECAGVRVIHQENKGLSEARNTGIRNAKGRYIVFLDGDDRIAEGALAYLQKTIIEEQYPDYIISRRKTLVNGQEIECNYYFDNAIKSANNEELFNILHNMKDCWVGAWIFTLAKEFIERNNLFFFPGLLHEDEEWVPRVIFSSGSRAFNNAFLYVNRVDRAGSITATPNIKRLFDKLRISEMLVNENQKYHLSKKEEKCIKAYASQIVFGIICEVYYFKKHTQFNNIIRGIQSSYHILGYNKKFRYKATWIMCRVLGIKRASHILYIMNSRYHKT